jgi:hypothetical protein
VQNSDFDGRRLRAAVAQRRHGVILPGGRPDADGGSGEPGPFGVGVLSGGAAETRDPSGACPQPGPWPCAATR